MCKHHQTLESLRANAFLGYIDKLVQLIYIYHVVGAFGSVSQQATRIYIVAMENYNKRD